ncbi:putative kunitz-type protease inhibitor [Schistosoma mansoni]|nr:putative kunitz-type protease inhibitor [Schistosoma mansoni]|eukprot:XP_018654380.1 putative kunitz-type protease inhibitor [Schistosoma mansoni]
MNTHEDFRIESVMLIGTY